MFEKAERKLEEVRFFAEHLHQSGLRTEVVEFYLSALLNAGTKVTYALVAEVVSGKSWQAGFDVASKLEAITKNKTISGRQAWQFFRELVEPKWAEGGY